MTNRLEQALEQTANVFMEMANEIRTMRAEIAEMQILINKHETTSEALADVFKHMY